MSRLSDRDVAQFVARLHELAPSVEGLNVSATRPSTAECERAAIRLQAMAQDGSLAPLLTQRLAAYIDRPLRCRTAEEKADLHDATVYAGEAGGLELWVRLHPLLSSALADAMVGGEGDPSKAGLSSKTARVATGAAHEMLRALAQALNVPQPATVEIANTANRIRTPSAQGSIAFASTDYAWDAGIDAVITLQTLSVHPASRSDALERLLVQRATREDGDFTMHDIERGLALVVEQLEGVLHEPVRGTVERSSSDVSQTTYSAWLRMTSPIGPAGAIVVSIEQDSAVALVSASLGLDGLTLLGGGALMESGAEVLLRTLLQAFAGMVAGTPGEPQHVERLSDETMLAQQPYATVDQYLVFARRKAHLRWLVPAAITGLARQPGNSTQGNR